jgi:hypothetical protein
MRVLPDAQFDVLEKHVLHGYLSGLRTSGFDVDAAELRRLHAAAASVHYGPMLAMAAETAADEIAVAAQERRWGVPFATVIRDRARVIEHALELGEAALS